MSDTLLDALDSLESPHTLVVGDSILDRYIWGDAERVSQEAPVVLLRADRDEVRLGGAANVANMLLGLGARATLATVIGCDFHGAELTRELVASGIDDSLVLPVNTRPTTVKERFIGRAQNRHPHQMLRVDREVRDLLSASEQQALLELLLPRIAEFRSVLISDYGKGVCTPQVIRAVIAAGRQAGVPVIVDPRPGQDYACYQGATAVTPNRLETRLATGIDVKTTAQAFEAGRILCERLALDHAYVTLDSDGIALVPAQGEPKLLPTRRRQVYDITGAGDMVLATIGVGLASGLTPEMVGRLANIAGGLEVERVGVVPISRDEMRADILAHSRSPVVKICALDDLARHVEARRKQGQKIVLTNGCFDLLHAGHVTYLQQAAQEGDCLIVALNSDNSIRRLNKGPERPIFPADQRAAMLAALEAVDHVLVFDESTPHALLERLRPDVLVKGGTYRHDEIVGWEIVEAYGGRVLPMGVVDGLSTSSIVARLREQSTASPRLHLPGLSETPELSIERKAG
ncbi:MAG: D-glycero-beta-D-manno-heptose 1-phosphate adenylyltransferase [Planctomycetaceae bacterium]|nr:MAG: D-glycero-beta-D-manno-heptose 1-phosphate adenylyltransferase [Planctomycetaceae bacterium]